MTTVSNYKGVEISTNSITGMSSANVQVLQVVIEKDAHGKPEIKNVPKPEKLFGRPKNVKQWIDRYYETIVH